jgi:hypothetical protein
LAEVGAPFSTGFINNENGARKQDSARNKITKALAKKEGRMPAKWKPDRIEASQAGNGPLSGTRESGHRPDRRLNAISADE